MYQAREISVEWKVGNYLSNMVNSSYSLLMTYGDGNKERVSQVVVGWLG